MNTPAFMPIKTYLKGVEFESPNAPELFFNAESAANLKISIDVQSKVSDDTYYLVELHTRLIPKIGEQVVFNLKLVYSTLVEILDKNMDDEQRKFLLTVIIPQSMYNPLRALVWDLTSASGFPPIMMNDYDFATHQVNTELQPFDNKLEETLSNDDVFREDMDVVSEANVRSGEPPKNIYPLGWEWILEDVRLVEDGSGTSFLKTVKDSTGHDLLVYEESPLFKYFYRFLIPIEYNHPNYKECDNSYWPILFQLLFAESENVKVIARDNGLPEIEFDYCEDERRTVSSLTLDELKWITSVLSAKALTSTLVDILGYEKQVNTDYANRLKEDQLILKEEFHALYNTNQPDANAEDIAFVENMYARIKECDLQTFAYKF